MRDADLQGSLFHDSCQVNFHANRAVVAAKEVFVHISLSNAANGAWINQEVVKSLPHSILPSVELDVPPGILLGVRVELPESVDPASGYEVSETSSLQLSEAWTSVSALRQVGVLNLLSSVEIATHYDGFAFLLGNLLVLVAVLVEGHFKLVNLVVKPVELLPGTRHIHCDQVKGFKLHSQNPALLTVLFFLKILNHIDWEGLAEDSHSGVPC